MSYNIVTRDPDRQEDFQQHAAAHLPRRANLRRHLRQQDLQLRDQRLQAPPLQGPIWTRPRRRPGHESRRTQVVQGCRDPCRSQQDRAEAQEPDRGQRHDRRDRGRRRQEDPGPCPRTNRRRKVTQEWTGVSIIKLLHLRHRCPCHISYSLSLVTFV